MPVFRPGEWNDALTAILRKHLTQAAFVGVELEQAASPIKSFGAKGIGDRLKAIIKASVDKVLSTATGIYHGVNETTGKIIEGAVSAARKAGETAKEIAGKVRDILTGESGKERAADIARTETTTGLSTGQDSQRQAWTEDGYELNKTWHTCGDARVREAHEEADGQTVAVGDYFSVGGEQCGGPGDPSLSADNRCGCRCWTTTSV